jgi:hypothetical protein
LMWSVWRLQMLYRLHPEINYTFGRKVRTGGCVPSLQSDWCKWFAGRCSRRTSHIRVTSCLTSGCLVGLMQKIHQHGSSAIMQQTNNNLVRIRNVCTALISDHSRTVNILNLNC